MILRESELKQICIGIDLDNLRIIYNRNPAIL